MIVTVQLFAVLKESLGDTIEIELPEPATVGGLRERFLALHPRFRPAAKSLNIAVDLQYSQDDEPIRPGQEVAIFPPVSGGAP